MTSARAASIAALALAALATSGCGIGTSYAVSADYANAMNGQRVALQTPAESPAPAGIDRHQARGWIMTKDGSHVSTLGIDVGAP